MTDKMRQLIICLLLLGSLLPAAGRKQMSVAQAWKWQNKMGEIRGFNQPELAYPGMSRDQILRKASELGLNSVRSWIYGRTVEEQIDFIRHMVEDASRYGLTYSPVLSFYERYYRDMSIPEEERLRRAEEYIRQVVGTFSRDKRIAMWDIWNEPSTATNDETMRQMDWLEKMVEWCRSENPVQPITSSIIWEGGEYDTTTTHYKRRMEIERMMDIHNVHTYRFLEAEHTPPTEIIRRMKEMDGRPLVSSECMARTVSGGLTRTLKLFAREHVNFYLWGMFITDSRNWSVQWGRTTYDPYEPIFHDLLYSDGTPYDYRELEALRKFRFEREGEQLYAPLSQSERWTTERAWKWVAGGPVKGLTETLRRQDVSAAGNSIRLKLNYADFAADEESFLQHFGQRLEEAARDGMTVLPVLLSDQDILDAQGAEIAQARFLRTYLNDFAENGDGYLTTPFAGDKSRDKGARTQADSSYWGSDFSASLSISQSDAASFARRSATRISGPQSMITGCSTGVSTTTGAAGSAAGSAAVSGSSPMISAITSSRASVSPSLAIRAINFAKTLFFRFMKSLPSEEASKSLIWVTLPICSRPRFRAGNGEPAFSASLIQTRGPARPTSTTATWFPRISRW